MAACAFGDPACPCQDGDACHYVDTATTKAMRAPSYAVPKPEPMRRVKGRKARTEAQVKKSCREQVFERDQCCRLAWSPGDKFTLDTLLDPNVLWCDGDDQLMHLRSRASTRKMDPTVRHRVDECIRGCARHHRMQEGKERPRLDFRYLTDQKANGPIEWSIRP